MTQHIQYVHYNAQTHTICALQCTNTYNTCITMHKHIQYMHYDAQTHTIHALRCTNTYNPCITMHKAVSLGLNTCTSETHKQFSVLNYVCLLFQVTSVYSHMAADFTHVATLHSLMNVTYNVTEAKHCKMFGVL